jgi:carboxyl-terminal processing protease
VPRLRVIASWTGLSLAALLAFLSIPNLARATNAGNDDRLMRDASELERKGDWRGAAEAYWKVVVQNRGSVEAREKYLYCLRRLRLTDRHSDPTYRKRIQELPLSKSLNAYLDALGKIQANYVDRDRIGLLDLFRHGLEEFSLALVDPVFRRSEMPNKSDDSILAFIARLRSDWTEPSFHQISEVVDAVKEIALAAQTTLDIRPSIVAMEFVCGACNTLDERSAFLPPSEEYTNHLEQLSALGMLVASNADSMLSIEKVAVGSWASQVGLKDGDRIVRMARKDEKGEVGPLVEIGVVSPSDKVPRAVKLPESLPSVLEVEMMPGGIGCLRIASFQKTTLPELEKALAELQAQGMRALILDLRGNPGGLFPVSVQVAERFLPEGIIVTTQGQVADFNRTFESHSGMAAVDLPLFVLIDGETASAAEVLAGALKDNQRAMLIGSPTFGKGTIQTVMQLTDGGGVRLTLARFFTPRGQPYNGVGVTPHLNEAMRPREAAVDQARATLSMRP